MRFFAAVDALPRLESMKFPVFSLLTGNFGLFRDEFAADSPLLRGVRCEVSFSGKSQTGASANDGSDDCGERSPGARRTGPRLLYSRLQDKKLIQATVLRGTPVDPQAQLEKIVAAANQASTALSGLTAALQPSVWHSCVRRRNGSLERG
jgi:hypothetical protein